MKAFLTMTLLLMVLLMPLAGCSDRGTSADRSGAGSSATSGPSATPGPSTAAPAPGPGVPPSGGTAATPSRSQ